MARSRAQPIKWEYFWRLANQESVILPSLERKLRKNALCLNQSAISNFALYVIRHLIHSITEGVVVGGTWVIIFHQVVIRSARRCIFSCKSHEGNSGKFVDDCAL